jgi:hypothetical protein
MGNLQICDENSQIIIDGTTFAMFFEFVTKTSSQIQYFFCDGPTHFVGLGLPNIDTFGVTLRLRWLWLARTYPDKM